MSDDRENAEQDRNKMVQKAGLPLAHFLEDAMKYVLKSEYQMTLENILKRKQGYEGHNRYDGKTIENLDLGTLFTVFDRCITNPKTDYRNKEETTWQEQFCH
ncbi:MAG: hypothetical protein IAE64_07185, partial [Flavobacteriales bacterium]|nr:hypothetical protein [Flavobacteriales bacterium]